MLLLLILAVPVLAVLVWTGSRLMVAGHQLERETEGGRTAAKVDHRLQYARARVETLVMPEVEADELQPSPGAHQARAQTYSVLGLGLLGLAVALALGVLLVL